MPLKTLDSQLAFDNIKNNNLASWPPRTAMGNRIEPMCKPGLRPSFQLSRQDKIFTIGSCFARHIEDALDRRGFEVVTRAMGDQSRFTLNNYSVPSMLNELQWALEPKERFDEEHHFFEVRPGRYVDAHLPNYIRPAPLEEVRAMRKKITDITKQVVNCSTVIMTLGLVEVWFDTLSNRYLNQAPPKSMVKQFPDRFQLHVMDYETTLAQLRQTIATLKKYCPAEQKIVLTVSPVPLLTTFDVGDVLIANCYSKSLLRAIASVVVFENDHIDYYPSYESVTMSERHLAWAEDQHHVAKDLIKLNVGRMIEAYTSSEAGDVEELEPALIRAKELRVARDFRAAVAVMEPVAHLVTEDEDKLFYAELCVWSEKFPQALELLTDLPAEIGGWQRQVMEAKVLAAVGEDERALKALRGVIEVSPRRVHAYAPMVDILKRQGALDEAVKVLYAWSKITTDPRVFVNLAEVFRLQGKIDAAREAYEVAVEKARAMVVDEKTETIISKVLIDYVEFLQEVGDSKRARDILEIARPANQHQKARQEKLKVFLGA